MDAAARLVLKEISKRIGLGRYLVRPHCSQRMRERGLFWSEDLAIVELPQAMQSDGFDDSGRDRWFLTGASAAGPIELLVVIDERDLLFWTIYWS